MPILSDYDYILPKLKCKLHVIVVLSRGYTNMITSNFTLLKIIEMSLADRIKLSLKAT